MSDSVAQLLTSTVVAAFVSASAILLRELVAARLRKPEARAEARRQHAIQRLQDRDLLLREIDNLWQTNARLAAREALCQRRCRALASRIGSLERQSSSQRKRTEELARLIASKPS